MCISSGSRVEPIDDADLAAETIAAEVAAALAAGRSVLPFSMRGDPVDIAMAYRAAAALRRRRGDRVVGRKIGFTNRTIWERYAVDRPMWGDVLASTLIEAENASDGVPLDGLSEPRLEPEVVLGLTAAPRADMDEADLIGCIGWIAPGLEIVQSIYPGWQFDIADTIVAGGLHAMLIIGERIPADDDRIAALPTLTVRLNKGDVEVETGNGANVLDGPVSALRHLVALLNDDPLNPPLEAGEIVSTGTLTDAWPIAAGEVWSATFERVPLPAIEVRFR